MPAVRPHRPRCERVARRLDFLVMRCLVKHGNVNCCVLRQRAVFDGPHREGIRVANSQRPESLSEYGQLRAQSAEADRCQLLLPVVCCSGLDGTPTTR